MKSLSNQIDRITETIGKGVSWLCLTLVILIGIDVALRYILNWSSSANQEMEWHIFATLFLLGSAYTLKHDKHVRVDVFYAKLSTKNQALINLIGTIVFLLPFAFVIFWTSIPFAEDAYKINESSPEPGGLPHRFMIKSMIPTSAFILFLQGISELLKSFNTLTNHTN
ncbi:TRAP transporter small permease subunit [Reichenbachiella versicolor]|uniref:TRAP transporter small permease subunit n=1 Tax=Reichenbachiella versicolor TaxID=1821036 RepID=UPI000D6E925A|nr:TRAP transporter small permease subunit [Reichenbachiella versicolor]